MGLSIMDSLALMSAEDRRAYIDGLGPEDLQLLLDRDWSVMARPEQLPPPPGFFLWNIRAGRGWGKTKTGGEGTLDAIKRLTPMVAEGKVRWALGAPKDRDVLRIMLEGETGLQRIIPPSMLMRGSWEESLNRSDLVLNLSTGAQLLGFSARVPDSPRGYQFHGGWFDEPGSYADAHLGLDDDTFMANVLLGMRLDPFGGLIVTGTPKNNRLVKELRKFDGVVETHGRTSDNLHNLAEVFKRTIVERYAGTRLGRQELDAEIVEGIGVLFQRGWFRETTELPWHTGALTRAVRYWDLASGEPSDANPDPDYTAGALVEFDPGRRLYMIHDVARFRQPPGLRENRIRATAIEDKAAHDLTAAWFEKEPGNAGTSQLYMMGKELEPVGVSAKPHPVSGPKAVRAELVATAAQQGRVFVPEGAPWLAAFLDEAEEFHPDPKLSGPHDDQVDCVAGAFAVLREYGGSELLSQPSSGPQLPKPTQVRDRMAGGVNLPRPGGTRILS